MSGIGNVLGKRCKKSTAMAAFIFCALSFAAEWQAQEAGAFYLRLKVQVEQAIDKLRHGNTDNRAPYQLPL